MALEAQELLQSVCYSLVSLLTHLITLFVLLPIEFMLLALRCGGSKRKSPKHIAITGASSGLGEGLAVAYAKPGVTLSLSGRNTAALEKVAAQCKAKGAAVSTRAFDVATQPEACAAWLKEADAATPIDLVIANAGVSEATAGVQSSENLEAAARQLFSVNIMGVVNTLFPLMAAMKTRGKGQLAIMASVAGYGPLAGSAAYAASKTCVRVYGEALRLQLKRDGISVNTICPGYVETPLTAVNKFSMPFIMDAPTAIRTIIDGLERDLPNIVFPLPMGVMSALLGSLHWTIRDFFSRNRLVAHVAYMRKSKKAAAAAAAETTAEAAAVAPASGKSSSGARKARKEL